MRKHFQKVLLVAALMAASLVPLSAAQAQEKPLCDVYLVSTDAAPASGTVEIYANYVANSLWPDGWMVASTYVGAGQQLGVMLEDLPCGVNARAWFTPDDSDIPYLLPSQYYPGGEFGTDAEPEEDEFFAYYTNFAGAIEGDNIDVLEKAHVPAVADGAVQGIELDTGETEWGYYTTDGSYVLLGWSWTNPDGSTAYGVPDGGPVTVDELIERITGQAAALSGGALQQFDLGDGLYEWGYWNSTSDEEDDIGAYVLLGWSQVNADDSVDCIVPDDGPVTASELCRLIPAMD